MPYCFDNSMDEFDRELESVCAPFTYRIVLSDTELVVWNGHVCFAATNAAAVS